MITEQVLKLRILPRWVIIFIDVLIVGVSTILGYILRFNFDVAIIFEENLYTGVLANAFFLILASLITKGYAGIVRYTGVQDGLRVTKTLLLTHLFTIIANLICHYNFGYNFIPYSVILISFLASFVFMFQYRLLVKNVFSYYRNLYKERRNVAIYGAGQMGVITKHLIDNDSDSNYKVVAFLEDNPNKVGKEINATIIYSLDRLEHLIAKYDITEVIIAIQELSLERKNEIVDKCLQFNIKIRAVPSLNRWIKGELSLNQIKDINIDDLLERDSIKLDNRTVERHIQNKRVLVSGAAGSIGSELVGQLIQYGASEIVLIDQSESALYELHRTMEANTKPNMRLFAHVADITDKLRMRSIFNSYKPQLIYHAAAYKHVPFMEDNVSEAVKCNILGTKYLADLALEVHAEKFVMVSTDKAVNPTNVMGCSKRIAEIYVQSLNNDRSKITKFVTTRFGNVLGSNGSVIPYFKKQIAEGGPVTVTHPEITRYFMTISEACELVIEAGTMGEGGEIFLFDMGKSVKIVDLAKKMIQLSGYQPYKEIDIIFTGLRKGEKLYEELLANKENALPTHHEKILIAKVKKYDLEKINFEIKALESLIDRKKSQDEIDYELVALMKKIVPEFISNSSRYAALDKSVKP
ncbi:MAG: nucleoside-diphosphate sugar epimerase/dehydratase [Fulvivirga sp.]|nr:nucleoside-diphosphate sugar epimerase/dehydratase [Fulvivirga sp.]